MIRPGGRRRWPWPGRILDRALLCAGLLIPLTAFGQGGRGVFTESFDLLIPPALPPGWSSSRGRNPLQDDWTSSSSSPRSLPNALLITNATISQTVISSPFSFGGDAAGLLRFALRRSPSFTARVAVDASTDGGATFAIVVARDLLPEPDSRYSDFSLLLPSNLNGAADVRFRWSTSAAPTGTTGTLRLDDVSATSIPLFDCAACSVFSGPDPPREGELVRGVCLVTSVGALPPSWCEIAFRWMGRGGNGPPIEAGTVQLPAPISPGDTISAGADLEAPPTGEYHLTAILRADGDANPSNDTARTPVRIGARPGRGVINEIMYAPFAGGPEWIEIVNRGEDPLDLSGWSVGDDGDPLGRPIAAGAAVLGGGECAVLVTDTALFRIFHPGVSDARCVYAPLPALNNTGDLILLNDCLGMGIDSVRYLPGWHHPALSSPSGRSLERVSIRSPSGDPRNWGSSADPAGCTPGRENSISCAPPPGVAAITAAPNPFAPDGDGRDDRTAISYRNPGGGGTLTLRVYDVKGRVVRTVADNEPCAPEGVLFWDGMDDGRRKVRIGIYVLLLEIIEPGGENVWTAKGTVVVAGRL